MITAALAAKHLAHSTGAPSTNTFARTRLAPPLLKEVMPNHVFDETGVVSPKNPMILSVTLPAMEAVTAVLLGDSLRWVFHGPGGVEFEPGKAKESAIYEPAGSAGMLGFRLRHPATGKWSVEVSAIGPAPRAYAIDLQIEGHAPVLAHLETMTEGAPPDLSPDARPGDMIYVRTFVVDRGKPIPSLRWDVQARTSDGSVIPISVFDDGRHADGLPSDGIFVGAFRVRAKDGLYSIRAATRTLSDVEYVVTSVVAVDSLSDSSH